MYEDHWGLTGHPFAPAPDPHCWFETAALRRAMAYLRHALGQGEGFVVVTGDAGTGKTALIGRLTTAAGGDGPHVLRLASGATGPLRTVAAQLGIDPAGIAPGGLPAAVERGLHAAARQGRRALLVVDDAHELPDTAFDALRMMSDFEAGDRSLVQIVLAGQSVLRDRLHGSDELAWVRRRVIAGHHLDPLGADEIADYVAYRLSRVGWQGRPDWAEDAFPALFAATGGVPRRINLLATRVMADAEAAGQVLIDAAMIGADRPSLTLGDRIAALEIRLQQQDEALRRVLRLLGGRLESLPRAEAA